VYFVHEFTFSVNNVHNYTQWTFVMKLLQLLKELELPDLEDGDELMVGKFKNRKATIKGFTKDKHNQPIAKTDKGDQQIFKGRVKKLMDEAMFEALQPNKAILDKMKPRPMHEDESMPDDWDEMFEKSPALEPFFDEWYSITKPHWDEPTVRIVMNQKRNNGDDFAAVQVKPYYRNQVHLSGIQSSRTGRGNGNAGMKLLLDLADKHKVGVDLNVQAYGGGLQPNEMTNDQLSDWYEKQGFESYKMSSDYMFRNNKNPRRRMKRGAAVTESFDTTTEMPDYDDLIKSIGDEYKTDYFRQQKGKEAKMVDISPDEYLNAVDRSFKHGVMSGVQDEKVNRYAQKMRDGETFPALTLDYSRSSELSQEGRHRALAAKAVGIESVPVLVVTPTPEEAKYRGITEPNPELLKTMKPRPMREGPVKIGGSGELSPRVTAFMSDYNASTVSHPFRREARIAMNREHNSGDDFAIIELRQDSRSGDIYLSSIQSSRGGRRGNGAAGLKLLTDLADEHRVMLELDVEAFGSADDTLSDGQLKQWYKRAGFVPYGNGMVRYPYDEYYDS